MLLQLLTTPASNSLPGWAKEPRDSMYNAVPIEALGWRVTRFASFQVVDSDERNLPLLICSDCVEAGSEHWDAMHNLCCLWEWLAPLIRKKWLRILCYLLVFLALIVPPFAQLLLVSYALWLIFRHTSYFPGSRK